MLATRRGNRPENGVSSSTMAASGIWQARSYPFSQPMRCTGIVDRALSTSFITVLPEDEQNIVRAKVKSIIESDPLR